MKKRNIYNFYRKLLKKFGKQNWWPYDRKYHALHKTSKELEICLGAILTQNTNWKNVEKSLENLKKEGLFSLKALRKVPTKKLARIIRPSGYYNIKASRLKEFVNALFKLGENEKEIFSKLKKMSLREARKFLLSIKGIGKETADSILLYALNKPIFIIDSYTKKIFKEFFNLNFTNYDEWQNFFHRNLPRDIQLFKEYHALIVKLGKEKK